MIDEHDLRALLAEAADAAPPPGRAPEELLEAVRAEVPAVPRARVALNPRVLGLAAALLVAVLGLARLIPGDNLPGPSLRDDGSFGDEQIAVLEGREESEDSGGRDVGGNTGGGFRTDGNELLADAPQPLGDVESAEPRLGAALVPESSEEIDYGSGGAAAGTVNSPSGAGAVPGAAAQVADSAKVVKTGSLVLEVDEGAYAGTIDRITTSAVGLGGHVSESTTNRSDDALSGTITVRVPAAQFDAFLADLRKLGTVEAEGVRGVEVSAQYTDLQARLASVTATRDRLQSVLAEASNIGDIIAVQDRITGVQTEIEQLQGQLRLLDDQVAMGTLSVSLAEPGADQVAVATAEDDGGLGSAWDDARRHFGNGVEDVVSWSGTGAVLLIVGAVIALAVRFGWRRARRLLL